MKAHTKYLTFNTARRRDYVNITAEVARAVAESGVREGLVLVSAMHITASVYVNDDEQGLIEDIDEWLERLAPTRPDYKHHRTARTTATRTSRTCSCTIRCCCRSRRASWTWGRGRRFTTPSSTGGARSG